MKKRSTDLPVSDYCCCPSGNCCLSAFFLVIKLTLRCLLLLLWWLFARNWRGGKVLVVVTVAFVRVVVIMVMDIPRRVATQTFRVLVFDGGVVVAIAHGYCAVVVWGGGNAVLSKPYWWPVGCIAIYHSLPLAWCLCPWWFLLPAVRARLTDVVRLLVKMDVIVGPCCVLSFLWKRNF